MSRHRIVHTFDANEIVSEFDGDDYEEEENELSPEDKVAMANGTAQIRAALGTEADNVTTEQIQEALWHYYYDVDKSVTYLMKTFIAPAPKPTPKKHAEGKCNAVSFPSMRFLGGTGAGHERPGFGSRSEGATLSVLRSYLPVANAPEASLANFFDDMPWLNVPKDRQATFVEPLCPRGGLLGGGEGAPKMSKLQALAAARKKKTEEKKEQDKTQQTEKGMSKLSLGDNSRKESRNPIQGLAAKRQKLSEPTATEPQHQIPTPNQSTAQMDGHVEEKEPSTDIKPSPWDELCPDVVPPPRLVPSAFARTLCGPAFDRKPSRNDMFPMPYASSPAFRPEAFNEPSPDEIVLAAQAKGSNFSRTK